MVFEAHCMSFPCTELLLFNYAKVKSFPFYGTFNESLTEWFFVKPKMVLLWHRCEEPFKHLYF